VELRRQAAAPCIAGAGPQRSGSLGRGVRGGVPAGAQLAAVNVAVQVCSAGGGFGSRGSRLSSLPQAGCWQAGWSQLAVSGRYRKWQCLPSRPFGRP
jgi:hypothetical protein